MVAVAEIAPARLSGVLALGGLLPALFIALGVAVVMPVQAATEPDLSASVAAFRDGHFHRQWPQSDAADGQAAQALLDTGQPWRAALLAARREADGGGADAAAVLASAAARCGMRTTAIAALARAAAADRRLLADAASEVARRLLDDAEPEAAIAALAALPPRLDRRTRNRASLIKARAQLALGRAQQAAQTLQAAEFDPLQLIGAPVDERLAAGILQYDLALALIRGGARERGRALLERLGRSGGDAPVEQALRDRANLSLATDFLVAGQGATARATYERVTLDGPYSNRALLGMGWAALGPQGDAQASGDGVDASGTRSTPKFVLKAMQRRRLIDCETYNRRALAPTELCRRQRPFEQADVPDRPESLAEEALLVWQALGARDPRDPAVREAWSAIGHAAARAGQRDVAIGYYEAAVARLETALADNAAHAAGLAADGIDAALAEIPALAPGEAVSVAELARVDDRLGLDATAAAGIADAGLNALAEIRWLMAEAAGSDADIERLRALESAQVQRLRALGASALDAEEQQLRRWLASVRAALATLSDPAFVLEPELP